MNSSEVCGRRGEVYCQEPFKKGCAAQLWGVESSDGLQLAATLGLVSAAESRSARGHALPGNIILQRNTTKRRDIYPSFLF